MLPPSVNRSVLKVQRYWHGRREDLGASFCVEAVSSQLGNRFTYYATAGHVVASELGPGRQLLLRGYDGREIPADVLVCGDRADIDVALLRSPFQQDIPPLQCCIDLDPHTVMMYGFPSGLADNLTALRGEFGPSQAEPGFEPLIEFFSPDLESAYRKANNGRRVILTPDEVWRGISGGPAIAIDPISDEPQYAIGIVTKIAPGGLAKRVRCNSVRTLKDLALKVPVYVETLQPPRTEAHRVRTWIGSALQNVDNPVVEQRAWLQISNSFFKDRSVLFDLEATITNPRGFGLDDSELPFIHYFLGRLHQKTGGLVGASARFQRALEASERLSDNPRRRLKTLVRARTLDVDRNLGTGHWHDTITALRHELEDLRDAPPEYIALEVASLIGYQSTRLFLSAQTMSIDERDRLVSLADEHAQLLPQLSAGRSNQQVVSTALQILSTAWLGDRETLAWELRRLTQIGFAQASANRNSIFHVQMLLARAIMRWYESEALSAIGLSLLAGRMMAQGGLTLRHEGIAQLFEHSQRRCQVVAGAIRAATERENDGSAAMMDKLTSYLPRGVPRATLFGAIIRSTEIWDQVAQREQYFDLDTSVYDAI